MGLSAFNAIIGGYRGILVGNLGTFYLEEGQPATQIKGTVGGELKLTMMRSCMVPKQVYIDQAQEMHPSMYRMPPMYVSVK